MSEARSERIWVVFSSETDRPSGTGLEGSGPHAGVCCSSAEWSSSSSWWRLCETLKMELLQGWMPAVV